MSDHANNAVDLTNEQRLEQENTALRAKIADWEHLWSGLTGSFTGVTDNENDPGRLHSWQWLVDHWHIPIRDEA